jgi:hypothetical protein
MKDGNSIADERRCMQIGFRWQGESRELLSCVAEQRYFAQLNVARRRYDRQAGVRV